MTDFALSFGLSLYTLCKEDNVADKAKEDLNLISFVLKENPDYIKLLDSPMINKIQRCSLIDDAFSQYISEYVLNFLKLLTEKRAMHKFADCEKAFTKQYNEDNNIETAVAVTAVPLSDELKEKLTEKLAKLTNKTILLENNVDSNVIGGLIVRFSNSQIDASIKSRLNDIGNLISGRVIK